MKSKNKYIDLKKANFLEDLTDESIISHLILWYGDALSILKESVYTGEIDIKEATDTIRDLILGVGRLDTILNRKNRIWWSGKIKFKEVNLIKNQRLFIVGLFYITDTNPTRDTLDVGIKNIQQAIETFAEAFHIDIYELINSLYNDNNVVQAEVNKEEYKTKGTYVMKLNVDSNNKYKSILLNNKEFNTGVLSMDFFKASIHAIKSNKEYGVKIEDTLRDYIDSLKEFFIIKFYNYKNTDDNVFYTLESKDSGSRFFRGDEDITDKVAVERNGVLMIPFVDYSMALVTPDMQNLDDLLDYYNKNK